jgi:hypothetical protein
MTQRISRRRFILSTLLAGISLYLGGWWIFKVRQGDTSDIIATLVRKKLDYLQLDEAGLNKFAEEYGPFIQQVSAQRLSWLGMFSPLYLYTDLLDSTDMMEILGEQAAIIFLISSDFFWYGSDETRVINYLGLYNPYVRPCANPFAKLEDL